MKRAVLAENRDVAGRHTGAEVPLLLAVNENRELGRLTERQRNLVASRLEAKVVRSR